MSKVDLMAGTAAAASKKTLDQDESVEKPPEFQPELLPDLHMLIDLEKFKNEDLTV